MSEEQRAKRRNGAGSILVRLVGLLSIAAIGALLVAPPLLEKRQERRVKSVLLDIQEALQEYHVDEELYPERMMSGRELVQLLTQRDFLDPDLPNPWSGGRYLEEGGEDWLEYRTGSLAETYELIVRKPHSDEVQFRLDSTENQSLEG